MYKIWFVVFKNLQHKRLMSYSLKTRCGLRRYILWFLTNEENKLRIIVSNFWFISQPICAYLKNLVCPIKRSNYTGEWPRAASGILKKESRKVSAFTRTIPNTTITERKNVREKEREKKGESRTFYKFRDTQWYFYSCLLKFYKINGINPALELFLNENRTLISVCKTELLSQQTRNPAMPVNLSHFLTPFDSPMNRMFLLIIILIVFMNLTKL